MELLLFLVSLVVNIKLYYDISILKQQKEDADRVSLSTICDNQRLINENSYLWNRVNDLKKQVEEKIW